MSGVGYPPRNAAFSDGLQQPYHNHDGMNQYGNAFVHSEQKPGLALGGQFPPTAHNQPQKPVSSGVAQGQLYAHGRGQGPSQPSQNNHNSYMHGSVSNSHHMPNATGHPSWPNSQGQVGTAAARSQYTGLHGGQPGYQDQQPVTSAVANGPLPQTNNLASSSMGQSMSPGHNPASLPPQPTVPSNSRPTEPVGPHPSMPQPGSAFTSLSPAQHSSAGNSVSNATHQTTPGVQGGTPPTVPYSMSALSTGKPKRPAMPSAHVTGGTYSPVGAGTPTRGTPPSSGPPTPSQTPSPYEQGAQQGYPSSGQDGQAGRPLMSKRRQYPAQTAPPTMPGQAALGSLPTSSAAQWTAGYPGQMPNNVPNNQMPTSQGLTPPQYRSVGRSPGGSAKYPSGGLQGPMGRLTVQAPRGCEPVSLMEQRHILPSTPLEQPQPELPGTYGKNCHPSVLCCTVNAIPETKSLLTKSKLPLGIHLHPFKDLQNLPVIHSSIITRCRSCRTYINPFVTFTDSRRWRCPMCFRINDVPDDFCYDPTTKTYGDPSRRPEVRSATVEFIAPSEYMLRPPQPLVLLFVLDVSFNAIETGYLHHVCRLIKDNLDLLPGDSRTMIGFMTFNNTIHFYNLKSKLSQPQMLIVSDLDDVFLPSPDDLLVNLKESRELVVQLLDSLPDLFRGGYNIHSATGAALQAAFKLISATGGRITLFQTTLPNIGPGALKKREDPTQKSSPKDVQNLTPATDFYKKFALDCAAEQVAVDLFLLSGQYADIASLMCASKYSGGCVSYFPEFHSSRNLPIVEKFEQEFERYLTRKIGLEAVMRVRCTRGLSIHTFHGNFFVRSTDLVSLPNVNPDTAFSMQMDIEDSLTDSNIACFQSALLYTSSKGERRIRVHTMAIPITTKLSEVYATADPQAIATLLAKMAVDRTLTSSLGDAREALMNASVDFLNVFRSSVANQPQNNQLIAPHSLRLLPLFVLALLKHLAFRLGSNASLDARCYAMQKMKTMPLSLCMLSIYPRMYPIHDLSDEGALHTKAGPVPQPPIYHLSGEKLSRKGMFLMDAGQALYLWVGKDTSTDVIQSLFNVPNFSSIPENLDSLPELDNPLSERARVFIGYLQSGRTCYANLCVIREDSRMRMKFLQNLIDDRSESVMSYYEYLVHLQKQLTK